MKTAKHITSKRKPNIVQKTPSILGNFFEYGFKLELVHEMMEEYATEKMQKLIESNNRKDAQIKAQDKAIERLEKAQQQSPIPFDLERALKGDKVVTRDGREVLDIRHFPNANSEVGYTIRAVINGSVKGFTESGRYFGEKDSELDLFMAPKAAVTKWVNVILGNKAWLYDTEEEAQEAKKVLPNYLTTTKITWEE